MKSKLCKNLERKLGLENKPRDRGLILAFSTIMEYKFLELHVEYVVDGFRIIL